VNGDRRRTQPSTALRQPLVGALRLSTLKQLRNIPYNCGCLIHEAPTLIPFEYAPVMIVMGSTSDWPTMENASNTLSSLQVAHHSAVVSAHRTPDRLVEFARGAKDGGTQVIIAGAGGAAHLPGMIAAMTPLPVVAVPVMSKFMTGLDSLLSIAQMPRGVAVATQAVGVSGAFNAGLMAAQILALADPALATRLDAFRQAQTDAVGWEVNL